jgi:predicted transcriptional regulator
MSSEASTLLGLLADEDRLRNVAALVLGSGPATVSEVAAAAGLDVRRAAKALTRLADSGLGADADADADWILRIFVRDGQLVQIPAVHRDGF